MQAIFTIYYMHAGVAERPISTNDKRGRKEVVDKGNRFSFVTNICIIFRLFKSFKGPDKPKVEGILLRFCGGT